MSLLPRRASLSLALGLLVWASPLSAALAANDFQRYLDAALLLYEDFKYEQALAQLERARSVAHGVEQDVTVSLYEGIIHEQGGQRDEALAAFEKALVLDPTAKLPLPNLSPKVETDFERVRQKVLATRIKPPPPPGGSEIVPPHGVPRVVPATLLGASVVAVGVGALFGASANQQLGEARVAPYENDAITKFNTARGSALTANVLFGTAGLALAGAVVTWFLGPGEARPTRPEGGAKP